jgi:hypothetical protein
MRHLTGFVLAVAMAVALYFCAGWGVSRVAALQAHGGALNTAHGLLALGALAGTGLLLGILLAVPVISPLAAGLPGLVLLGWSALLVVSARRALEIIPLHGHGYYFTAGFTTLLVNGILALLGAVMVIPLFVPSRWRGRAGGDDADADLDVPAALGLTR